MTTIVATNGPNFTEVGGGSDLLLRVVDGKKVFSAETGSPFTYAATLSRQALPLIFFASVIAPDGNSLFQFGWANTTDNNGAEVLGAFGSDAAIFVNMIDATNVSIVQSFQMQDLTSWFVAAGQLTGSDLGGYTAQSWFNQTIGTEGTGTGTRDTYQQVQIQFNGTSAGSPLQVQSIYAFAANSATNAQIAVFIGFLQGKLPS